MRQLLLGVPLFALAACGGPANDPGSAGFDRARFRDQVASACRGGMGQDRRVPAEALGQYCGCMADRILATHNDEQLGVLDRDTAASRRAIEAAMPHCTGMATRDEPPPPEEPSPSMADGTPPPVVSPSGSDVADGPDSGGGASAPGGMRARTGALARYVTADDYPAAALRNNEQGRVAFTLDISPAGRVTSCRVTESSGSASLDTTTCRIMQSRARYTPARNPRGIAVADRDRAVVRWALPEG